MGIDIALKGYIVDPPSNQGAKQQSSASIGDTAARSDALPTRSYKPQTDLGKEQNFATAGDTVPIIFCKRVTGIGGTWVQPKLTKTGFNGFASSFLFAISQGEIESTPQAIYSWLGTQNIKFIDASVTLTHHYASSADMALAPDVCPITSGKIFCDVNTYSYLSPILGAGQTLIRQPNTWDYFWQQKETTLGVGDTSNSVIQVTGLNISVYDNETGADLTSAYFAWVGVSPSSYNLLFNYDASTGGGYTVGRITTTPPSSYGILLQYPFATNTVTFVYENATINNQYNMSAPASTGTLTGIQYEYHLSTYPDPAFPGGANFTTFADITFLEVDGSLYDKPTSGSIPTTARQLSIFYENGAKVDLYSGGLVGGVYAVGASNQFVDLAMYLFTLLQRANGASTAALATPIDVSNFQALAAFCNNNGLLFNGMVEQSINVIDYLSATAPFFLLSFISSNGRYGIQPLLPVDASNQIKLTSLTPVLTFTEADILPGSFQKQYIKSADRRPINVSLLWREADPTVIGIQRTTTVRYVGTGNDAPTVQFDMTDFCVDINHAILFGCYELARRKHATHTVRFDVSLLTTALLPTNIFCIERQRINSKGDNRVETDWYQATSIKHSSSGITSIEAMYFPVNATNISLISDDVANGSFDVI